MTKILAIAILALTILWITGCDKEKIVTSTEYVHDVEYIELPPDTILLVDTLVSHDSVPVYVTDTVVLHDTTIQVIVDTVVQVNYVYDTVLIYDTVTTTDTVLTAQCSPNEHLAFAALQYHTDPLVIELVNLEFGLTDGWIFYLSQFQTDLSARSSDVYDIYGFIDYWTVDWSGYYPLEYYWRLSYVSGDPADPRNWQITEPTGTMAGAQPGIRVLKEAAGARSARR